MYDFSLVLVLSSGSDLLKNKKERDERCAIPLAESEGFEPPEQLPVHRISSAARSTTPATFLVGYKDTISMLGALTARRFLEDMKLLRHDVKEEKKPGGDVMKLRDEMI